MAGLKIIKTGSYLPENVITNFDLEKMVETNDEWIQQRTGIISRHQAIEESAIDMAVKASLPCLEGIDKSKIKYVIVATMTPDYFTPSCASIIAGQLEIENDGVMVFDLSAACSGFVFGLNVAAKMLEGDELALVIGVEKLTKAVDFTDRSTCILFGDGAGAVVVSKSEADYQSHVGYKGNIDSLNLATCEGAKLQMAGQDIFKFAVRIVPSTIETLLKSNNMTMDDIDYVVLHQANARIIESVARKYGENHDKFVSYIANVGNTSGASIPLAFDKLRKEKNLTTGKVMMIGFGGGLTWGGCIVEYALR